MSSNVRTPPPARQRTGTIESFIRSDGTIYYRGKVRLADGSRERVNIDEPHCFDKDAARAFVRELQSQEDVHGRLVARKRGTPPAAIIETVREWCKRWLEWRAKPRTLDNAARQGTIEPLRVPDPWLPIHAATREDVERVVEELDRRISLPRDDANRMSWKTASNVWVLVSKMFKDAMAAKQRDLRVRSDNPAAGVAPPEHGDRKAKVYLYPSEFERLIVCGDIARPFRIMYAVAVYTYTSRGPT